MKPQLFFFITMLLGINTLYAQFGGGNGTENNPYQIYTKAHLEELNSALWTGNDFTGMHFRLMNDINDSLRMPIGKEYDYPFNGYFHGKGHNIVLAIDLRANSIYSFFDFALFPELGSAACIDSFSVSGYIFAYIGIVGENSGVINSCINNLSSCFDPYEMLNYNYNLIQSGICYYNKNIVKNCINNSDLYGRNISGICCLNGGMPHYKIINCTNNGNLILIDWGYAGGICKDMGGATYYDTIAGIFNCVNNGNITLSKKSTDERQIIAGGICCYASGANYGFPNNTSIVNCQNYGNIILPDAICCGGILGHQQANIKNCANYGDIEGYGSQGGAVGIGGIAGLHLLNYNPANIENCFNSGHIKGHSSAIGGIAIIGNFIIQGGNIRKCLNVGRVEGGSAIIDSSKIYSLDLSPISYNYYDKQRCIAKGIFNEDLPGKAEGKLTTELIGNSPELQAMLGSGWSYAEGRYPIPLGLENDSRAILHATPVYLYADSVQYDHVDSVRHYFTVGTDNSVTWASAEGKVNFNGQNATLLSLGSEILTANTGNYFNHIPIHIVDTIPVSFDTIPEHIATISTNLNITLYPNPATNELHITNYELRSGDKVEIYNILGQPQQFLIYNSQSIIDVSGLPSGMYMVRIGKFIRKFVKQ